ncbi:hypothetical protein ACQEUX_11965 [Micromonospora sp. CA-259024]|uniref:hypothetical protein n=1 Tax=Micromonospora sp. CA-259024 TaxID=3239965 RepID=UPI003D8B0BB9
MPTQEITWTACPNGRTKAGRLRVSVFIAPRLSPDFGPTPLTTFPDFVDWPERLRGDVRFSLTVGAGPDERTVPLDIVSAPPDSRRWRALLPPTTTVVGYQTEEHGDRPVCTYSMPDVVEAIQAAYLDTAAASTVEPPLNMTPPELLVPVMPGLDDLFSEFVVEPLEPQLPRLIGEARLAGQARRRAGAQAVAREMLEVFPVARSRRDHIARALAFSATPATRESAPPRPVRDFHERLSAFGDHPALLRALGLVVDTECDVTLPTSDLYVTTMRVHTDWTPLLPPKVIGFLDDSIVEATTANRRPRTAVGPQTGMSVSRRNAAPGVLPLPEETFLLEELDVDGAVHKAAAMVSSLSANPGDRVGPPALRTGGLALIQIGLPQQMFIAFAEGSIADGEALLFTEDLTRGYRMDVRDADLDGRWRSLHRRSVTYEIEGDADPLTVADEEGLFAVSMRTGSADPTSEIYLHENLVVWNGWSLSAPRPERPLENPGPAPQPAADEHLRLTVRPQVLPGSLPRLRFGHTYQVRLRTVDVAGNALGPDNAPDVASGRRAYLRFEPVAPPVFAPGPDDVTPDGQPAFGPGESVHRLVVRNYLDGLVEPARRDVLAPRGSAQLAELHGRLDDAIGTSRVAGPRADGLRVVSRDGNALTFPVGPVPPYLPDPLARGVSFRGLPQAPGPSTDVPFAMPTWHEPHTFALVCTGADPAGPLFDEAAGTLTVPVEPGAVAEVRASSLLAEPELMALLRWVREHRSAAEAAEVEATARASGHCMFTPWQTLTLVHAVLRPLATPDLVSPPTARHGFNDSDVNLAVTVSVHAGTTGTISLVADWRAQVDDLTQPAWSVREQHGTVFTHTLPEGWQAHAPADVREGCWRLSLATGAGGSQPPHQLGETRHRRVAYRMVSTTKYSDHFDPVRAEQHGGFALDGASVECEILNSAPAPALAVLGTVPALLWQETTTGTTTTRVRRGGVRVYLQRPWFATGDDELLGVVVGGSAFDAVDTGPRANLVSRIGQDATRAAGRANVLRPGHFRNATATIDVELAELRRLGDGGPTTATVLGFVPAYDEISGRWFCDIDIDTSPAYLPFVRLVVARFQPASIRDVRLPDDQAASPDLCVVSPVVALDPIVTLPDRRLTYSVNADRTVDVYLAGVTYESVRGRGPVASTARARSRVWIRWASRPAGSTAPWTFDAVAARDLDRDDANGLWRVTGLPSQATSADRDYRLLVLEVERTPSDLGGFADRVVFADAIAIPAG